jgi:undecaprenyl-phosphate 4-deoxy-4-formamido-L-arabinose transferase
MSTSNALQPHLVSVVVPVYKGELTLPGLVAEIVPLVEAARTPSGTPWRVTELILVVDHGPDRSAEVVRRLAREHSFIRTVWLSRNFGQHSATLAGMASSGSEWIATLDEDGQHEPAAIGALIDSALLNQSPVVYARPTNPPPHGLLRNASSRMAKGLISALSSSKSTTDFQSFRLVLGEVGRSVAAYSGSGVYLDVALGWVAPSAATANIELRSEGTRTSGYSTRKLLGHFWRLVLSSGTRALRIVSIVGVIFALLGVALAIAFAMQRVTGGALPAGWTSTITTILVSAGAILFSLGIIAEYLGVAVNMAMGKPPYLIVTDLERGPLGRAHRTEQ